jgi:hypothetical protein
VDGILSEAVGSIVQVPRTAKYADPIVSEDLTGCASGHVSRTYRSYAYQRLVHSRRYDCAVLVSVSVFPSA